MQNRLAPWSRGTFLGSVLLVAAAFLAPVHAEEGHSTNTLVVPISGRISSLAMSEKSSRVLQLAAKIKTVDGFDPTVLKVTAVSGEPTQIRLQGLIPGVTSVVLVDEHGTSFTIEVLVNGDVKHLEGLIREAFPDASVRAVKVKDSVLLMGWVNQPEQLTSIVEIAEQFHPKVLNSMRVSGAQQVMLQVKMMEVQRNVIRNMGFNFFNLRDANYVYSIPGNMTPLAGTATQPGLQVPFGGPPSVTINPTNATAAFGLISNDNIFQGFIEALKQESMLKILAEPNLIAVNGHPANFLSGGEYPIPIPQGLGTVSVQFKPFGVKLEFVPVILGNGRLRMECTPEVSEPDITKSITVQGITVPAFNTRKASTQVEMSFGQTLIIAGLISNQQIGRTQKVPFLGELPWVGAAFRRVSLDEAEVELLIMVTPEYVAPLSANQMPPGGPGAGTVTPTDRELYGHGVLETARFGPDPEVPGAVPPTGPATPPPATGPNGEFTPQVPPAADGLLSPEDAGANFPARGSTKPYGQVPPPSDPTRAPEGSNEGNSEGLTPISPNPAQGNLPQGNLPQGNPSQPNSSTSNFSGPLNNIARRPTETRSGVTPLPAPPPAAKPSLVAPRTGPGPVAIEKETQQRPTLIAP